MREQIGPTYMVNMWLLLWIAVQATCFTAASDEGKSHVNAVNGYYTYGGYQEPKYVCPPEFVRSGNSCYYLSSTMATWQESHFHCKDRGAALARMEKQWEDKNMRSYLNKPELASLERWIGGRYNWEIKKWVWGATARNLQYQGFSRMKPRADHQWHCIVMDPVLFYRWSTRNCLLRKHYICEKRLKNLKPHLSPEILQRRKARRRKMDRLIAVGNSTAQYRMRKNRV